MLLVKIEQDVSVCFQDSVASHLLPPSLCYLNIQLITFKQAQPCSHILLVSQFEYEPCLLLQPDQKSTKRRYQAQAHTTYTVCIFNFMQLTQKGIQILPHIPCLPKYIFWKRWFITRSLLVVSYMQTLQTPFEGENIRKFKSYQQTKLDLMGGVQMFLMPTKSFHCFSKAA